MPNLSQQVDVLLDLRGSICPITLLKVRQVFRTMKSNQVLEVLIRDTDTRTDLFKILPNGAYELIDRRVLCDRELYYRIRLKKKERA